MLKRDRIELTADIVLIDIINFSKLTNRTQLEVIESLTKIYTKMIELFLENSHMPLKRLIHSFIPTGDGFYCILNPRLKGFGIILGLSFNHLSEEISKKLPYFEGIKIAINTGKIYEFVDILGHKNYIGNGLNDCARLLEYKGYTKSAVIVSDTAYDSLKEFLDIYQNFHNVLLERELKYSKQYTFEDKHNITRKARLVWLRNSGIINPPDTNFNSMLKRN